MEATERKILRRYRMVYDDLERGLKRRYLGLGLCYKTGILDIALLDRIAESFGRFIAHRLDSCTLEVRNVASRFDLAAHRSMVKSDGDPEKMLAFDRALDALRAEQYADFKAAVDDYFLIRADAKIFPLAWLWNRLHVAESYKLDPFGEGTAININLCRAIAEGYIKQVDQFNHYRKI